MPDSSFSLFNLGNLLLIAGSWEAAAGDRGPAPWSPAATERDLRLEVRLP